MIDLTRILTRVTGYLDLDMCEDAWDELENLPPELRGHDDVLLLRLAIYHRMSKWESASILAESLAKQCPGNPQWWIYWASSLRREQSPAAARAVLIEAAALHPNEATIIYNLACYSCLEDDTDVARTLLKQAITLQPKLKLIALDDPDLTSIIFGE